MTTGAAWKSAQQAAFVHGPSGYVPTHPAVKAAQAKAISDDVKAFEANGGKVITIPTTPAR